MGGTFLAAALAAAVGAASGGARPGSVAQPGEPAGGSTERNPTVVFSTPGLHTVTLKVCNQGGCSSLTKTLLVLDPHPEVTSISVTPALPEQGQSVLLDAEASGEPPLAYSWQVLHNGVVAATLFGAHTSWPTAGQPLGTYSVSLSVTNTSGAAAARGDFILGPPGRAAGLFTVAPCRALDTRRSHQPLSGSGTPQRFSIGGVCGVPVGARAVAANVTAVAPTAGGFVSVYPADLAHPVVSWVNFNAGVTRANFGVLPLSTDGTAQLAAAASLTRPGSVDLLVDVLGYFASPGGSPPAALVFQARLCPFGFCEFAAGTEVFFSQAFSGTPSEYRYDWTGSGVFSERSPTPVKSHAYPGAAGAVTPAVEVAAGSEVSTLAQATPMYIVSATPPALPAAPEVVAATFLGYVTSSPVDPTIAGLHPAYQLVVANTPPALLGYNVYASKDGGPFVLVAALEPALPASEPLVVDTFSPPSDSLRITVSAVSFAGEGPRSASIALAHP